MIQALNCPVHSDLENAHHPQNNTEDSNGKHEDESVSGFENQFLNT